MPHKKPSESEFEWKGEQLVHKPTEARWWFKYPNSESLDMGYRAGNLGNVLPNGDDYRQHEVIEIALRLLAAKRHK